MEPKENKGVSFKSLTKKTNFIFSVLNVSENNKASYSGKKLAIQGSPKAKTRFKPTAIPDTETGKISHSSFLKIGKITHIHGLKGEFFISLFSHSTDIPLTNQTVQIRKNSNILLETVVQAVRPHKTGLILWLKGLNTRQEAECLKGAELFVPKKLFSSVKGENIYLCEVLHFEVQDKKRGVLGKIFAFSDNSQQDFLLVQDNHGIQVEIPFIRAFVTHIDFESKKIQVNLPLNWPGILD